MIQSPLLNHPISGMKETATTLQVPKELALAALRLGAQYHAKTDTWFIFGAVPPLLARVLQAEHEGGYVYPKQLSDCPVCGYHLNHIFHGESGSHFYRCGDETCPGHIRVDEYFNFFATKRKSALFFEPGDAESPYSSLLCRECKVAMPRTYFGASYWRVCVNSVECGEFFSETHENLEIYKSFLNDDSKVSDDDFIYGLGIYVNAGKIENFAPRTLTLDEISRDLKVHAEKIERLSDLLPKRIYYSEHVDSHRLSVIALLGLYLHGLVVDDAAELFNTPIEFRKQKVLLWQITGTLNGAVALESRLIDECKRYKRVRRFERL